MLSLVTMALGSFRFGVGQANYQSFSQAARYRWEQVNRVGAAPAAQFAGPDVQSVTLEGVFHPHYHGGLSQMRQMRAIAGFGNPLMLTDGLGFVWNRWVVVSIEETQTYLLSDGAPRQIAFTIELESYGEGLNGTLTRGLF